MAYRTVRPLRVGGLHYAVGEALPEGCLIESRAKELLEHGYIESAPDAPAETPEQETGISDAPAKAPAQEEEHSPEAQPKAKGRKKTETAGDA